MKMESVTGKGLRSLVNEAESGEIESMAAIGECYLLGHGVEKDEREGYKWIGKAAKDGHEFAIAREVDCLSLGMGVEQNLGLARYILEKNAEESKASGKEGSSSFALSYFNIWNLTKLHTCVLYIKFISCLDFGSFTARVYTNKMNMDSRETNRSHRRH